MLFAIESHAVDRYIERHAPNLGYNEAYDLMWEHANQRSPVKLKRKTNKGDDLWQLPELGILIVAKFQNGVNVAVTCIPDVRRAVISEEERERLEDYRKRIAEEERKLREEKEATERAAEVQLADKELNRKSKAKIAEELKNTTAMLRRKLSLMAEERALVKDILGNARTVRENEERKLKTESAQAISIRKLEKALKISVKFLMDQSGSGGALEKIRIIDERYVSPDFYNKL